MEIPRHLREDDVSEEDVARRPPEILMVCRGGAPVECPTMDDAKRVAEKFSGKHPGTVVGVYQLVGFAFTPERPGSFVEVGQLLLAPLTVPPSVQAAVEERK